MLVLAFSNLAFSAPAHVHGEARLEIVIDGNTLGIHLETPLDALLGFEHSPRRPAEKAAVKAMKSVLEQPERLFQIAPEAKCTSRKARLESPVFEAEPVDGHLDLDADYQWHCAQPSALRGIGTRLFVEFPGLKRIKLEFIGPAGQKAARLSAEQPRLAW